MSSIKIGCDPEGFLQLKNGEFVSAFGIIPGTKREPFKVDKGAIQVDGVAVEFNIDPAETEDEFNSNITTVIRQMTDMVQKVDKSLQINFVPVARFDKVVWDGIPEDCKILGCDPDYNIEGQVNENPMERLQGQPIRTAAGHIHIGWTDVDNPMSSSHFDDCLYIARGFFKSHLPTFVPDTKAEEERLGYYGSMGAWRPKKYGVELRAPSNRWVSQEATRKSIFNQTKSTFNVLTGI